MRWSDAAGRHTHVQQARPVAAGGDTRRPSFRRSNDPTLWRTRRLKRVRPQLRTRLRVCDVRARRNGVAALVHERRPARVRQERGDEVLAAHVRRCARDAVEQAEQRRGRAEDARRRAAPGARVHGAREGVDEGHVGMALGKGLRGRQCVARGRAGRMRTSTMQSL
jgi:hypothetical protein